jgi:uncharacterized PurR-regulated membrane protein YhhQ (DUF165 family)
VNCVKIALYVIAIASANIVTAALMPFSFGPFIVPAGTFLIGATFILRDLVQNAIGRRSTYGVIVLALILSAITSFSLGDTLWITAASAITFALSEIIDTEIYTRFKATLARRVFISGIAGGTVDSAVFVIIGLSPLGAGFVPWEAVPYAIIGQVIVKAALQGVGAIIIGVIPQKETAE